MTVLDRAILGLATGIALGMLIGQARSAEWQECENVAASVEKIVVAATGDDDLLGYIKDRAFSHCLLMDEVPVKIDYGQPANDWALRCAMQYRSFRPSDGTVVRRGTRTRVRCPL